MVGRRRPDVIEIWVEPLADVTARLTGERPTPTPPLPRPAPVGGVTVGPVAPRMPDPAAHPLKGLSPTFRRLVDIAGDQLPGALGEHTDRHLVLGQPRRVGTSWTLRGTLRRTIVSRRMPVDVVLMPYTARWTLLELIPRRQVRVGQHWFRNGHQSIDRFVAELLHRSVSGRETRPPALG